MSFALRNYLSFLASDVCKLLSNEQGVEVSDTTKVK